MYRNEYMKKRLKALDKAASEAPKPSLEEAMEQYDRHEKWAVQADQNSRVPRGPGGSLEEFRKNCGR